MRRVLVGAALPALVAAAPMTDAADASAFSCASTWEYSSCAKGVGALAGRITASALACGLPARRWTAVGERLADVIRAVAAHEADRQNAMRTMRLDGEETLRRWEGGEDRESCASIARSFNDVARRLGVP